MRALPAIALGILIASSSAYAAPVRPAIEHYGRPRTWLPRVDQIAGVVVPVSHA